MGAGPSSQALPGLSLQSPKTKVLRVWPPPCPCCLLSWCFSVLSGMALRTAFSWGGHGDADSPQEDCIQKAE